MAKKFKETNAYTIIFTVIMVVIVGSALALTAMKLGPFIDANKVIEKKQNILQSLEITSTFEDATDVYKKHILEEITINANGEVLKGEKAFDINLVKEIKKEPKDQRLPLYIAQKEGKKYFVIPLRGTGLWGPIWGYVSLEENLTIQGVVFDHASETPGLGAEIKQDFYKKRFVGEKIVDAKGNFTPLKMEKGAKDTENKIKDNHSVDAITGATITSVGVGDMIKERLSLYMNYLKKVKK